MSAVILLGLVAVAAYKTKPDTPSFRKFITEESKTQSASPAKGWLNKITNAVTGVINLPDFKVTGWVKTDGTLSSSSSASSSSAHTAAQESRAEQEKEKAVRLKRDGKYAVAATTFLAAGRKYEQFGPYDAALCCEEAYKCFKQANDKSSAIDALHRSAILFNKDSRSTTRAARAYETLAENVRSTGDLTRSLEYYNTARDAFETAGDGRAKTILTNIADITLSLHNYTAARTHYETLAAESIDNSTLRFSVPKYLVNGVLCTVAEGDWVKAGKVLEGYGARYVAFGGSGEFGALKDLISAHDRFDADGFQKAYNDLNQSTLLPEQWKQVLLKVSDKLQNADVSFR
ncbi:hypothetical protein HK097_002913 [Rhizophlyctis rosea]|uniref:TPR-like protein n=1 Tax=Rhizophlyctis rosea TaxID=64517 RepID=A0AAD5SGZ2_9FUNG|nr:hypothetical protein HK097_002913 [Rhizophlyctis rosea]